MDRNLVGVLYRNLNNSSGGLGISSSNLEIEQSRSTFFGITIARLDADIDTLFQNENIAVQRTNILLLSNYGRDYQALL